MNRRYITLPMLLLVLSLSSGCGTTYYRGYEGLSLPESQIAVLTPVWGPMWGPTESGDQFCIGEIDGKPTGTRCLGSGKLDIRFELLPGQHTVSVKYSVSTGRRGIACITCPPALFLLGVFVGLPTWTTTEEDLTFEAEAGHTYDIDPWQIKDTTTGQVVFDRTEFSAEKEREKLLVAAKKAREKLLVDAKKAREKFLVDAENGDPEAQFQLYTRDKPDGKSLTWLCLAANQGHALAQEELGDLHVKGLGQAWREAELVELDPVRAYVWYTLAAANGDRRAGYTGDALADQMTPEQIAEAKRLAIEWKPGDCGAEDRTAKSTK